MAQPTKRAKPVLHPTTGEPLDSLQLEGHVLMSPRGPIPLTGPITVRDINKWCFD